MRMKNRLSHNNTSEVFDLIKFTEAAPRRVFTDARMDDGAREKEEGPDLWIYVDRV